MAVLLPTENPSVFSRFGKKSAHLPQALEGQQWYVAQLKSRTEKQFAHLLADFCVSYFLPMQPKQTANGIVTELIFTGFCFFLGWPDDVYHAWETRKMWGILKTKDQKELRADLRDVARVVRAGLKITRLEDLVPGRRVRIITGHALAGMEAKVDLRKNNRVWLDINMIGAASFEVDANYLEVI